jgi:ribosomal protein L11 methyltransferase
MAFRQIKFSGIDDELLALLSILPFEAFQEEKDFLIGYIEEEFCDQHFYSELNSMCESRGIQYEQDEVEHLNWNQQWESSFHPIIVDNFCSIKASFHDKTFDTDHCIIIDPKMAFGTGHHETTYMMIQAMKKLNLINKKVLDHGCGTGILSILAEKCNARHIDAIDIEEESFQNTIENAQLNNCQRINAFQGELNIIKDTDYDVILANINRKVLLDTANAQYRLLRPGGCLLLSGILHEDREKIDRAYTDCGFIMDEVLTRGNWLCIRYLKPGN